MPRHASLNNAAQLCLVPKSVSGCTVHAALLLLMAQHCVHEILSSCEYRFLNNFYSFTTFKQNVLHCCGIFLHRSVHGSFLHPLVMAFRFFQVGLLWLQSPCPCVLVQGWWVCVQLGGALWVCVHGLRYLRPDCFRSGCIPLLRTRLSIAPHPVDIWYYVFHVCHSGRCTHSFFLMVLIPGLLVKLFILLYSWTISCCFLKSF